MNGQHGRKIIAKSELSLGTILGYMDFIDKKQSNHKHVQFDRWLTYPNYLIGYILEGYQGHQGKGYRFRRARV